MTHRTLKWLFVLCAMAVTPILRASNIITYTASSKLQEETNPDAYGLHAYAFNVAITSHEFVDSIGTIIFEGEVTSIGYAAFSGCFFLTSITIPNSVTSIGDGAFYRCYSLTSITIPNSVTSIGHAAFSGCFSLTSITIPNSVTSIGDWAFADCTSLTSITIPNSVTSIGEYAFCRCSSLTSVNIPNGVTSIGYGAFDYCTSLSSVTIGSSVTSIGEYAFCRCSSLTSVNIPNSVTSIGSQAFYECTSLTSVNIPNSVTSIGDKAFDMCSIKNVTCWHTTPPEGLRNYKWDTYYVPYSAIETYKAKMRYSKILPISIENVHLQISPESTGEVFADYQQKLTGYKWDTVCTFTAQPNYGYHFDKWSDGSIENPHSFILTQNTTFIAFFDRDTFLISTQSARPDWGYTIGDTDALYLDSVTLEAIPYYGYEFDGWTDWNYNNPRKEVVDKDKSYTAEFKKRRFSISTMSINGHIEGVPYYAEYLDEVTLTATPSYGYHFEKWSDGNIENPRTFTITQDTTFSAIFALNYSGKCGDNLYWQYQNDTLTITGNNAMYDEQQWVGFIDSISVVSLPEGCTYIGEGVFQNMEGLSELTIPTSVTEIGENAFDGCRYLFDVYCYSELPPVAQKSTFYNFNANLHVPCESLKAYQTDAIFGSFKYIQCAVAEDVLVDTLTIIPNSTDAIFMWPMNEYAATYVIEIIKDGKVYCTLTFNSAGQLLNIAFAPGRNSNYENAAQLTANGFMFSVMGLKQGSDYAFSFVVKNEEEQPIQTINGEFQTKGIPTNLNHLTDSPSDQFTKIIKDGQLIILRDGKTYNAQGGEL